MVEHIVDNRMQQMIFSSAMVGPQANGQPNLEPKPSTWDESELLRSKCKNLCVTSSQSHGFAPPKIAARASELSPTWIGVTMSN